MCRRSCEGPASIMSVRMRVNRHDTRVLVLPGAHEVSARAGMLFRCSQTLSLGAAELEACDGADGRLDICHFGARACANSWRMHLRITWRARRALATRKYRHELACCYAYSGIQLKRTMKKGDF